MNTLIEPGATIGILGGGQLGRMMAMSARSFGYRVRVMDPDPFCPASKVVDDCIEGAWNDLEAASLLANQCDVVTLEIAQVAMEAVRAASQRALLRPSAESMYLIQDRNRQKDWLVRSGFPVGDYATIDSYEGCLLTSQRAWPEVFLKRAQGGYDGRSQLHLSDVTVQSLEAAWGELGRAPCVAEKALSLEREISVLVARSPRGEVRVYPAARNHHEKQILVWSVLPASLPSWVEQQAQEIAASIVEQMSYEGILAVEMFLTSSGGLLVNELAPRPHNSYHASERACSTSQFEQAIRAVCNLPLGDTTVTQPTAIANLLGDLWEDGAPRFENALALPGIRLHLYEKQTARRGRKMGHLSAIGQTPEEAVERVMEAWHALRTS